MQQIWANNDNTTLAGSISSGATSMTLISAGGFPNPTPGLQYVVLTITPAAGGTPELVWGTALSGSTYTILRAQEGSTALAWNAGDTVGLYPTAGTQQKLVQNDQEQLGTYTFAVVGAGTVNAIAASVPSALTALSNGMIFRIEASGANTGAATFDLTLGTTSTGAQAVKKFTVAGSTPVALAGGELPGAGYPALLMWVAGLSCWILLNPAPLGVASQSDIAAGNASNLAVTPAALVAGMTSNPLGANGYISLWGDAILEYGIAIAVPANTTAVITLPLACLNRIAYANYSAQALDSIGDAMQTITSPSTTQFTLDNSTSITQNLTWSALCR